MMFMDINGNILGTRDKWNMATGGVMKSKAHTDDYIELEKEVERNRRRLIRKLEKERNNG